MRVVMLVGILLVAACSAPPEVLSRTDEYIVIRNVPWAEVREATLIAQEHCEQYGRSARAIPDTGPDDVITFECMD